MTNRKKQFWSDRDDLVLVQDGSISNTFNPDEPRDEKGRWTSQELAGYYYNHPDPDPYKTRDTDLSKYVETTKSILAQIAGHKDKWKRLTISDIVAAHPHKKLSTIQNVLGKLAWDRKIRLGPYTQSVNTHPHPEHLLPLDRERKFYIEQD